MMSKSEGYQTMSQALYRKYRSKSLDEIVGQEHVTAVLKRSLAQGRIAHAYLLTGPRGVGKTSIARILAYEINGLPYDEKAAHLDIIEIDAASNNGVEDVRNLREKVQIVPVSANKKVYIIDEVHMLSKAAFNALLKTLEEPPEHAVFILATTDAEKLPATIISRTQRFSLRMISVDNALIHLRYIAQKEKINISDEALALIASRGDGSFRDSISLLDQLRSLGSNDEITQSLVEDSLGIASSEQIQKILAAYDSKDLRTIVQLLDESAESGVQPTVLATQLMQSIRTHISDSPHMLPLLDQLLDVAKSSRPEVKLLTVLAHHTSPKVRSAALATPTLEIKAPLPRSIKPAAPSAAPTRAATKSRSNQDDKTPTQISAAETITELPADNWQRLIEYTRQHFVGLYSVLAKCSYEIRDGQLVLYTNNAFHKKKIDDSKQRINLSKALIEAGIGDVAIETIGTPPPPKDSTAAAVAAIMGGGEEVNVEA